MDIYDCRSKDGLVHSNACFPKVKYDAFVEVTVIGLLQCSGWCDQVQNEVLKQHANVELLWILQSL